MVKGRLLRAAGLVVGGLLSFTACRQDESPQASTQRPQKGPSAPSEPLTTTQQSLISAPALSTFALLAERSISLREHVNILGGAIGARATSTTGTIVPGFTLAIDAHADTAQPVLGSWVKLFEHAQVGPVSTDHFTALIWAQYGAVSAFAQPPVLPALEPVTPGSTAITVLWSNTATRAAGAYSAVELKEGATLNLSGGLYQMNSLLLRSGARIQAQAPVQIRVTGAINFLEGTSLLATGSGMTAASISVQSSASSPSATGTPAIELRPQVNVRGLFLAPNGTIQVREHVNVTGALAARDIEVYPHGAVTFQGGFAGGTCPASCDDSNPCTTDACTSGTCTHAPVAAGTSCSDGNACNGAEACNSAGACVAGTPPQLDDSNPCTTDTCNPATGVQHVPVAAGTSCSDGNACNGGETCNATGVCQAGTAPTIDDSNPCTTDTCDPATGVAHVPVAAGTSCSDGNACNGAEACNATGVCQAGTAPAVNDGNPCTADSCDPVTGVAHVPVSAGTSCSDSNACNGLETCDAAGSCQAGVAPTVDDGNPCTADSCDPVVGVVHTAAPSGTPCSDGDACTQTDTCQSGVCAGQNPVSCSALDACHGVGACDPATGACSQPVLADGTACSDGNACSTGDRCVGGSCSPVGAVACAAPDACHGAGTCDAATGLCSFPVLAGASCEDGDPCTFGDTCSASGSCAGTSVSCVSDPCVTRTCQGTDTCAVSMVSAGTSCSGAPCEDGANVCDGSGACQCEIVLPPDPALVAPPLDRTVASSLAEISEFLYSGGNPIQRGVTAGAVNPLQVGVCRGLVTDAEGAPLAGVRVSVHDHPELGHTLSRADGMFDLAINAGTEVVFDFQKAGLIPVSRKVPTTPQQFCSVPMAAMIPFNPQGTSVDLSGAQGSFQQVISSVVSDDSGTRRPVMLIPPGVTATMDLPGGTSQSLSAATVRVTEFTVGPVGPDRMPAALPPTSAYTYAAELSIDEAVNAGATAVRFSSPVSLYLDNFLGFPVGSPVPNAFFDRVGGSACCAGVGCWVPQPDGIVLKIVDLSGGVASVDLNGDGLADDPTSIGLTVAERAQLATLYAVGQSLWRIPVAHFSPLDANWPSFAEVGARATTAALPTAGNRNTGGVGDFVGCQGQDVGECVSLVGSSLCLDYQSSRQAGFRDAYSLHIPLTGSTLPPLPPQRVDLTVQVAGRTFKQSFQPAPNLSTDFTWDGRDVYGRELQGAQPVRVRVGFFYDDSFYQDPVQGSGPSFGATSGLVNASNPVPARSQISFDRDWDGLLTRWDSAPQGLGGWSLCGHHTFDPNNSTLYEGDGSRRVSADIPAILNRMAGGGSGAIEGPAKGSFLLPSAIAVAPDGAIYVGSGTLNAVYKVANGVVQRFAGRTGEQGYAGDDGPALDALFRNPVDLAVEPDGSLLIADKYNKVIRRVTPDGIIRRVAGTGPSSSCYQESEGAPATSAELCDLKGVAVGPDCSIYIADHNRIRRVGPDGIIHTFAGPGSGLQGDEGPARDATFSNLGGMAVGPDGSVYVLESYLGAIRRVSPDGVIHAFAGPGVNGVSGEGGPARDSFFGGILSIAVDKESVVYVSDSGYHVRAITQDGTIRRVAGTGQGVAPMQDGAVALSSDLYAVDLAVGPDNALYLANATFLDGSLYRLQNALPGISTTEHQVASQSGDELYIFDAAGRHLRTLDAHTRGIRRQFSYDSAGRLVSVTDGDGQVTSLQRDAQGQVTAIVAPNGAVTSLTLDEQGRLATIVDPELHAHSFSYAAGGMLLAASGPSGATRTFTYDSQGRVIGSIDEAGASQTLARVESANGATVTRTTQLGRASSIAVENDPVGTTSTVSQAFNGTVTTDVRLGNGQRTVTLPSGMISREVFAPDARLGLQAPLNTELVLQSPAGLTMQQLRTRSSNLANPADPFSQTLQTDIAQINGKSFSTVWNRSSRTVTSTSPLGRQVTLSLDPQQRFAGVTLPGLTPLSVSYDAQGRVVSASQGSNSYTRSYDARGNLASITNPLGATLGFPAYDGPGRPSLVSLPAGGSLALGYDLDGNVTKITPPGKPAHQLAYTPLNTLLGYQPPASVGAVQYTYNPDRQLVQVTRLDGTTIDLTYAANGTLTSIHQPLGTTGFAFSPVTGQLTTITAPDGGTLSYTYDGELLTSTTWAGTVAGSVARVFDHNFRLTSELVSGEAVAYSHDDDGLRTAAGAMTLTHHAQHGLLAGTSLGVTSDALTYDSFGALASYQSSAGSEALLSTSLTRNALGRVTQSIETVQGITRTLDYTYDDGGRLLSVSIDGVVSASYGFDLNGNRVQVTDVGGARSAVHDDQDRLLSQGTTTYTYAPDGERLTHTGPAGVSHYTHDAFGNLVSVTLPGGTVVSYVLDGKGRRVGKKVNGTLVQGFLYGDPGHVVAELDGAGAVVRRFVHASGRATPDYMLQGGVAYRLIADATGSVRLLVDAATGAVVQRIDYDAFGRVLSDSNPGAQPFGFAGGLLDRDTQLVHFGARDLDPETGRFLARDPLGFRAGDANLYAYASGDPVNLTDPSVSGADERVGGLPFSVGRLASFGYQQFRSWKKTQLMMGAFGGRAGGALDLELVNLSGEPVGLAPYRALPARSDSCAPTELNEGLSRRQWAGFRTCAACTFTDDLLAHSLAPIPAAAEIHGLPPCDPGAGSAVGGGIAAPLDPAGGVSLAFLAQATPLPVTGLSTSLSVLGADTAATGEAGLTYTWATLGTPPAAVIFATNGTNAARNTTATFARPGTYPIQVTIRNPLDQVATSTVNVLVEATPTMATLDPPSSQVSITGSQQFHATLLDQFGEPVFPTPTFDWSVSGGGEISPEGLFSSSGVPGGPHVVLATFDAIGAQASVSISSALPAIVVGPTATPMVVTGTSTELSILGMVEGGEQNLSYGWFASGPHGVQVTPNGDNAAKNATATFIAAGTYPIDVVVHDLYGQTAQSSVTVTVLPVARSLQLFPEIISVASSSSWSFLLKGIDQFFQPLQPSGVAWSVSGGGTIDSNGVLTTDSQTGGPYTVTATVNQVSASSTFHVANQPPDLLQAPLAAQKPVVGTSTTLSVLGTGVGGEAALTYDWDSFDGPAPVVFSPDQSNAAKNTTATFSASGVYQIGVRLLDPLGQQTSGYLELPVQPIVQAVSILPSPASGEVGQPINLAASVTDQFAHQVTRDVAFSWSTLSGPASASFAAPGAPSTSALFAVAGSYVLRTTATGGGQTRSADVAVQVTPPNQPPVIAMGLGASLQLPDRTATLSATVTDDGLPLQGTLSRFWSVVSGPAAVAFSAPESDSTTATFIEPGAYVLKLTAHDGKLTSSKTVSVNVQAIDAAKPVVALTGPFDGEEITAPTAITGSVSQGSWRLEYRLGGEGEGGWTPFASGTGPTSGTLATFDPTLLLNGVYAVRLVATTSGGSTQADFAASVTRNMKVGHFTLAFTDLQIPVSGLPITLVRSYDSRDKRVGDFGVGWQLAIKNARVEESRPVGRAWKQTATDTFFPTYTIDSAKSHDLTITFGGNKVYRFRAAPTPGTSFLQPIPDGEMHYEAVAPTVGSVQPLDYAAYMVRPGQPGELISLETLEELKLERFLLTTEDGTQWTVSKAKGVEQMVDRVGNTLVINDQGITHSSGKSVTFVRDADGRITTITDPNGNAMHYHYDLRGDLVDFTDRDQAKQAFTYQSDHLLLDYTDANGHRAVRNDYDADGRLLSQTDASGKSVTFSHSLAQRQEVVHDRLGHPTLFEYDTRGNVTRTVDAHGEVKTMTYDARDNKLTETDELGHTTTFAYDANDNEISRTDPLGHTWSKTWNAYRQVVTETDPLGHTTSNALNFTNGLLDSTTDALGHTTHFLHNVFTGDRVRTTDALGHATNYSYDNAGRVLTETDALGHQTTFSYDANGNKLTETTTRTHLGQPQVLVTTHIYDKHDRLVKTTHPDGSSTRTEYGPTGQVARRIDELGRVTAMAYDDLERLVSTTYPDGTTTSQTYDDEGRTVTRTDQAGRVTTMAYDELGRLLTTTHADLTSSGSTYDAAGRVQAQTNENGHTTTFVYDDANRRTQTINALGHATTTTYDAAGRTVAVTDPLLHSTTSTYDDAGRLTLVTFADGTSQSKAYDDVGRLTAMTDELGRVTSRAYDDLGRLTSVTDPLLHSTSYGYDELGRLTSQTDANNHTTSFAFDTRGRQIARTLPDGATETKTFDGAGNALTRTDFAGRTTVYSYDAMNRLLSRLYPDGSSVSFAYTPTGRRASFTDERGTTGYTYDVRDRVTSLTYPDGRNLAYGYDALGHRASLTANVGGQSLTTAYGYDLAERPASVTDPLQRDFSLAYDDAGRLTTMAYPNGTTTSYGYDARNRSTTIATMGPGNALVQSYALTLDNAGRRTAIAEGDGTQKAYGYDAVDRLVSETVSGGSGPQYAKAFTYDAVGNRLQQDTTGDGAASVSYSYDSRDRLVSEGATVYASDANGNVVSKTGEATYAWDFEQRLSSVTLANGTVVSHAYDPAGNRVRTTVTPVSASSVSTELLVDPTGGLSHVVAESSGGALGAVYVRAGGELLAVVRPNGGGWATRYVHHDMLDSVRALTDEAAAVVESRGYEAFGARVTGGADPLAYGFAGEPSEGESGLAYHRARWMDARAGRFLGEDPLMPGRRGVHGYVYASNSPVVRVDPSGEVDVAQMALVGALVGVLASQAGCSPGMVRGAIFPSESGGLLVGVGGTYFLSSEVQRLWRDVFFKMASLLNLSVISYTFYESLPSGLCGETNGEYEVQLSLDCWKNPLFSPESKKRLLGHETIHAAQFSASRNREVAEGVKERRARECHKDPVNCYNGSASLIGTSLEALDVLDKSATLEGIASYAETKLETLLKEIK